MAWVQSHSKFSYISFNDDDDEGDDDGGDGEDAGDDGDDVVWDWGNSINALPLSSSQTVHTLATLSPSISELYQLCHQPTWWLWAQHMTCLGLFLYL